jgi:hypothetical protein
MPRRIDLGTEKMSREFFKGRAGRTDIIALLEAPITFEGSDEPENGVVWAFFNHCIWPNGREQKPVQVKCRETDDCFGCRMAIKKPDLVDPSGKGDPFKRKYAALVMWLATKEDDVDSKFRPVGKVLPWRFGGDKARDLKPLLAEGGPGGKRIEIVEHDFNGAKIRLRDVDIKVVCRSKHDETVQKLGLTVSTMYEGKLRFLDKLGPRVAKEYKEALDEAIMPAVVLPQSNAELRSNIMRILKSDNFEFGEAPKGDAPAGESLDDEFSESDTKAAETLADDFGESVDSGDAAGEKSSDDDIFADL